jgi:hypothetical protein
MKILRHMKDKGRGQCNRVPDNGDMEAIFY